MKLTQWSPARLAHAATAVQLQSPSFEHAIGKSQPVSFDQGAKLGEPELTPRAPVRGFDLFPDLKVTGEEAASLATTPTLSEVVHDAETSDIHHSHSGSLVGPEREERRARLDVDQSPAQSKAETLDLDLSLRPPGALALPVPHASPAVPAYQDSTVGLQEHAAVAEEAQQPQHEMQSTDIASVSSQQDASLSAAKPSRPDPASRMTETLEIFPASDMIPRRPRSVASRRASSSVASRPTERNLQDEIDDWIFLEAKRQYDAVRTARNRFRKAARLGDAPTQSSDADALDLDQKLQEAKQVFQEALKVPSRERDIHRKKEADRNKVYYAQVGTRRPRRQRKTKLGTA